METEGPKCSSCDVLAEYLIFSPAHVWEFACYEHENEYARMFTEDAIDEFEFPIDAQHLRAFLNRQEPKVLASLLRLLIDKNRPTSKSVLKIE